MWSRIVIYYRVIYILFIEDSRKILSDGNMHLLSDHVGRNWKPLARRLGFHEGDIDCFEFDTRFHGLREIIWKMLSEWRERNAERATLCAMADALIALKLYDIAALLDEFG